jgi:hypothetical protein
MGFQCGEVLVVVKPLYEIPQPIGLVDFPEPIPHRRYVLRFK